MSGRGEPRLRNAGEAAFVVEFGNEISVELNERATALAALLEREPFDGFREAIPTFRSVLVFHDPRRTPKPSAPTRSISPAAPAGSPRGPRATSSFPASMTGRTFRR